MHDTGVTSGDIAQKLVQHVTNAAVVESVLFVSGHWNVFEGT